MVEFKLVFKVDDSWMDGGFYDQTVLRCEMSDIAEKVAHKIRNHNLMDGKVRQDNGKQVGYWKITTVPAAQNGEETCTQ